MMLFPALISRDGKPVVSKILQSFNFSLGTCCTWCWPQLYSSPQAHAQQLPSTHRPSLGYFHCHPLNWVAVKELKVSYHNGYI